MTAIAMISDSHWRLRVVHKLSLTKVQDICTIFCNFCWSPKNIFAIIKFVIQISKINMKCVFIWILLQQIGAQTVVDESRNVIQRNIQLIAKKKETSMKLRYKSNFLRESRTSAPFFATTWFQQKLNNFVNFDFFYKNFQGLILVKNATIY